MELKTVSGRILCSVNMEAKNQHTFTDGTVIRLERNFENFNKRETSPVNAIVIDAENIPSGAQILIGHNSVHDANRIFDYKPLSGADISSDIKYYSIPESEGFLWRIGNGEWEPLSPYETALRVFRPYKGAFVGIDHEKLKDVLYVTSGKLKGQVVKTLKACDYEIIFQNENGQEERKIRFRPFGDEKTKREEEAICILVDETEMVESGLLLIGLSTSDCKPLNVLV